MEKRKETPSQEPWQKGLKIGMAAASLGAVAVIVSAARVENINQIPLTDRLLVTFIGASITGLLVGVVAFAIASTYYAWKDGKKWF
jgi:Na+/H+-translocating membrane pyrophosphatase